MRWLFRFGSGTRFISAAILCSSLFYIALGSRHFILRSTYSGISLGEIPFAQESALQMRRVKMIFDRGFLPVIDREVSFPAGVAPDREYTVLVDYLQAALNCSLNGLTSFLESVRWVECGVFCLSVPVLFLCCWYSTGHISAGVVCALIYGVSISAVQRSTGAELSTENTAFPFLAAHLMFRARWLSQSGTPASPLCSWASACTFALALAAWDLMQFYAMIWAGIGVWNIARRKWSASSKEAALWRLEFASIVILAVASPYHRSHALIVSPAIMLSTIGLTILHARSRLNTASVVLVVVCVVSAAIAYHAIATRGEFAASYGHFGELLLAKFRFLNLKPEDPSLLTFQQRLLWTPALHSPTIQLTIEIMGLLLLCCLPAVLHALRSSESCSEYRYVMIAFLVSLAGYICFFRLHVFVALFGAMLVASWWSHAGVLLTHRAVFIRAGVGLLIFLEAFHTVSGPWGAHLADQGQLKGELGDRPSAALWGSREGIYHREQIELTDWLEKHVSPNVVLAGFGLSGPIAAYGKCAVTLHPKFETSEARERVREYTEQLFCGSLQSFRIWADNRGASYFVYGLGSFSEIQPTLQLRYMVNALSPSANSPARIFEEARDSGPLFRQVFANRKYKVYKILTTADEVASRVALSRASDAFEKGNLNGAEREATQSLKLNPSSRQAEDILKHVEALRGRGFSTIDE